MCGARMLSINDQWIVFCFGEKESWKPIENHSETTSIYL